MKVELAGLTAWLAGSSARIRDAVAAGLERNGCAVQASADLPGEPAPDIAVLLGELRCDPGCSDPGFGERLDRLADAMARRGAGRIVVVLSALAALPARRFPSASVAAGMALLEVRTLAMRFGPAVLVNAVGCGAIADPQGSLVAGDASLLSHVPSGQAGAIEDIVNAVLFLCDPMNSYVTGQMLTVDGGWSAGYGRNF